MDVELLTWEGRGRRFASDLPVPLLYYDQPARCCTVLVPTASFFSAAAVNLGLGWGTEHVKMYRIIFFKPY